MDLGVCIPGQTVQRLRYDPFYLAALQQEILLTYVASTHGSHLGKVVIFVDFHSCRPTWPVGEVARLFT